MQKNKSISVTSFISHEHIERKIYLIRGKKVMLDRDLANLYEVETRALNQAVRRNLDHFPEDFMFTLTRDEIRSLSQFVISLKHAPSVFAFTEGGVAMLSGVLNSKRAVYVNIQIIRTFIRLREILATHKDLQRKMEEMEKKYDQKFSTIYQVMNELVAPAIKKNKKPIGFHTHMNKGGAN